MFVMYFIHNFLTNMFRPQYRAKNVDEKCCNKIHHKHCSAYGWLFIYYVSYVCILALFVDYLYIISLTYIFWHCLLVIYILCLLRMYFGTVYWLFIYYFSYVCILALFIPFIWTEIIIHHTKQCATDT